MKEEPALPPRSLYQGMLDRCFKPNNISYKYYGGKGIKVCERWLGKDGYKNFCEDVGLRPTKRHSIDRIDNNGDYEPNNIRWATPRQQVENKPRKSKYRNITFIKMPKQPHQVSVLSRPWLVIIVHKGVKVMNEFYATVEEAIEARDKYYKDNYDELYS